MKYLYLIIGFLICFCFLTEIEFNQKIRQVENYYIGEGGLSEDILRGLHSLTIMGLTQRGATQDETLCYFRRELEAE